MLEFLRDVGKHFSVNVMLARDGQAATGSRGHLLHRVQLPAAAEPGLPAPVPPRGAAGSRSVAPDQWGNIVGGVELIRRVEGATAHALTLPLITDSEGRKFGKSTGGGNIWLDPRMTSPYAWYQYFVNVADADVGPPSDVHLPVIRGDRTTGEGRPRSGRTCAPRSAGCQTS